MIRSWKCRKGRSRKFWKHGVGSRIFYLRHRNPDCNNCLLAQTCHNQFLASHTRFLPHRWVMAGYNLLTSLQQSCFTLHVVCNNASFEFTGNARNLARSFLTFKPHGQSKQTLARNSAVWDKTFVPAQIWTGKKLGFLSPGVIRSNCTRKLTQTIPTEFSLPSLLLHFYELHGYGWFSTDNDTKHLTYLACERQSEKAAPYSAGLQQLRWGIGRIFHSLPPVVQRLLAFEYLSHKSEINQTKCRKLRKRFYLRTLVASATFSRVICATDTLTATSLDFRQKSNRSSRRFGRDFSETTYLVQRARPPVVGRPDVALMEVKVAELVASLSDEVPPLVRNQEFDRPAEEKERVTLNTAQRRWGLNLRETFAIVSVRAQKAFVSYG